MEFLNSIKEAANKFEQVQYLFSLRGDQEKEIVIKDNDNEKKEVTLAMDQPPINQNMVRVNCNEFQQQKLKGTLIKRSNNEKDKGKEAIGTSYECISWCTF
ncbi:RBR-type E3 ubiquitin transferase [Trifolium repens]|jgi:hypothetical protein|nr:hypothetical protein QL285_073111 [Trifolium repens]WJX60111.1 RBR-type E3 ubiquitin transferase [Trifolium repens]